MLRKIVTTSILTCGVLIFTGVGATGVSASEIEGSDITLSSDSSTVSSNGMRSSSATGTVSGSNPLLLKPRATATTKSKVGKVYALRAKVECDNNGKGKTSSNWSDKRGTTIATSTQLVATTEKATFYGRHEAKRDNGSSSWEYANTSIKF